MHFSQEATPSETEVNELPPQQPSNLLRLPTELRLCIYDHSTAMVLLQLASTCSTTRAEIHASPRIIRTSYGYWHGHPEASETLTIKDICEMGSLEEAVLWHNRYRPPGRGSFECWWDTTRDTTGKAAWLRKRKFNWDLKVAKAKRILAQREG
ncbi:hypothetical protein BJ508DRAFT_328334 [Ascobolus immersus RN42]|uniref:F-box domain-containing protein n=1 Tax=Ascobolus immersus RN42 TaxID=1160509 RepID=A0A3N4HZZ8_ASCIM|nr:hypothetical protein BJ508DRAFT_328334 [Ascobolus immersus RN42]